MKTAVLSTALLLSACIYTKTPYERIAVLDLPVHAQTTVNKTVTINTPLGAIAIYQDSEPVHNHPAYPVYPRRVYHHQ